MKSVIRSLLWPMGILCWASMLTPAEISLSGGNQTMTISTATAGYEPDRADNTSCSMLWSQVDVPDKIVVHTSLASPAFTLRARALDVVNGTAAGWVILSSSDQDWVVNIPAFEDGSSTLQYSASATASNGTGSEVHTVTYTIVAQ